MRLLVVLSACSLATVSLCRGQQGDGSSQWHNFLTFNTQIPFNTSGISFYDQRRREQMEAVNSTRAANPWRNADVVCLQEIGELRDRAEVVSRAKQVGFQYAYGNGMLEGSSELSGKACLPADVTAASACLGQKCPAAAASTNPEDALECLLTLCSTAVESVQQVCINCMLGNLRGSPAAILQKCGAISASEYPSNLQLLLLSKKPISNPSIKSFTIKPRIVRRGYLKADIQDIGAVYCTHLTPDLERINSSSARTAQGEQNRQDMMMLVKEAGSSNAVLMGDFNTGPAVAANSVAALFPQSYDYATSQGYSSPYVSGTGAVGRCTFSTSNGLVAEAIDIGTPYENQILDHVLVNPSRYEINGSQTGRVFDEIVLVLDGNGNFSLSDHYGVTVTLRTRPAPSPSASSRVIEVTSLLLSLSTAASMLLCMM